MVSSLGDVHLRLCNLYENRACVLQQSVTPWMSSVQTFVLDFQGISRGIPILQATYIDRRYFCAWEIYPLVVVGYRIGQQ